MANRSYPDNDFNQFLNNGGSLPEVSVPGSIEATSTTLGFYGATPVTQPAANADTSGAALAALETEVNQLKATLRALGLLAT